MDFSILAQVDTSQITEQAGAFFATLRPQSLADILVYMVFFLSLITTFLLPDGNDLAANLLYGTIILALFNITVGVEWYDDADLLRAFPAFAARICMFLLPFIAAGATRVRKNKGKIAMPVCIVAGVIGLLYALGTFLAGPAMDAVLF